MNSTYWSDYVMHRLIQERIIRKPPKIEMFRDDLTLGTTSLQARLLKLEDLQSIDQLKYFGRLTEKVSGYDMPSTAYTWSLTKNHHSISINFDSETFIFRLPHSRELLSYTFFLVESIGQDRIHSETWMELGENFSVLNGPLVMKYDRTFNLENLFFYGQKLLLECGIDPKEEFMERLSTKPKESLDFLVDLFIKLNRDIQQYN